LVQYEYTWPLPLFGHWHKVRMVLQVPSYTWPLLLIYYGQQTAMPHLSRIQSHNLLLFHATTQKLFLLPLLLSDGVNSISKVVSILKIKCFGAGDFWQMT